MRRANPPSPLYALFSLATIRRIVYIFRMDYAFLLVFTSAIALGVVSAVVRTWSLHRRVYSLEDRLGVLEGVQQREVKIRAAQARAPKGQADEDLFKAMQHTPTQGRKLNWWEKSQKVG